MSTANRGTAGERKQGAYGKGGQKDTEAADAKSADNFSHSGASQNGDHDADEQYGDGEAFDDDDAKAEGNGPRERRKIEIKFIQNKARRHITFSKRKHGIMKKAWELSVLTGTQVLLLVVSETGLVYTFTTPKLQPLVTQSEGKNLIQACLNAPESPLDGNEDSPEASQVESDNELSPQPANPHGDPDHMAQQAGNVSTAQIMAMRKAQAAQEAQSRMGAQNPVASPVVQPNPQDGSMPQASGQAAAVRAAIQAQVQALAVSGLPPHLQQLAAQGYKVPTAQYGYHGYPFSPVGGQFGTQLANLGQLGAQMPNAADTAALMTMQQQEGMHANNGEYPPMMQQPPSQGQPQTQGHN